MKILFINSSPNKQGNTARVAAVLLKGRTMSSGHFDQYKKNTENSRKIVTQQIHFHINLALFTRRAEPQNAACYDYL